MEAAKNFFFKNTTTSVKTRVALFDDLFNFLQSDTNVKDEVVKAILTALSGTLPLYVDLGSRRLILKLIKDLLVKSPKLTEAYLLNLLEKVAKSQVEHRAVCRSESAKALVALDWSIVVVKEIHLSVNNLSSPNFKRWIAVQSGLVYGVNSAGDKPISKSGERKLRSLLKNNVAAVDAYMAAMLANPSLASIELIGSLISIDKDSFNRSPDVLSSFVKAVVMNRAQPSSSCLKACRSIISEITHQSFTDVIMPAVQKALLRSPENCLSTVEALIRTLAIDLSRHVKVVVKMLSTQLVSKTEANADGAASCMASLSLQCSDTDAVSHAVEYLFAVLKGSEGKLTLSKQKLIVLSCIGTFASSPMGSGKSVQDLSEKVAKLFITFFQQETNEHVLVGGYSAFAKWCLKFRNVVPKVLVDWFMKVPTTKSHNPTVRVSYLGCVLNAFRSDSLKQVEKLVPYLVQTVTKAAQQPLQVLPVTEGVHGTCMLSQLENVEFVNPPQFDSIWTTVLDRQKQLFTSEKFLTNATDETFEVYINLIFNLFSLHSERMNHEVSRPFIQGLLYIGLNKTWTLRHSVEKVIKKLVSSMQGANLSSIFMSEFFSYLASYKDPTEAEEAAGDSSKISSRDFTRILHAILSVPDLNLEEEKARKLVLLLLPHAYHPLIVETNDHIWTDFVQKSGFNVQEFIGENRQSICELLVNQETSTQASLAALTRIVGHGADLLMPVITSALSLRLKEIKSANVTTNDIGIMNTPAGELWNTDVVKNAPKVVENKNIKRESKLYSVKEQKITQELQRESKKKNAAPTLSKKQKELMEFELEKEASIRERVTKLHNQFTRIHESLLAVCNSRDIFNCRFPNLFVPLIDPLLDLLRSPLASSSVQQVLTSMSKIFATSDYEEILFLKLMYATLRLCKPSSEVDPAWCAQSLHEVCTQVITELNNNTDHERGSAFFAFCFPFVRSAIMGTAKDHDVELTRSLIQFVATHVSEQKRVTSSKLYDVAIIPRLSVMETACKLITTNTEMVIQEEASEVMLSVCSISTGENGLAHITMKELDTVFEAMQSPVISMRITSVKALQILNKLVKNYDETCEKFRVLLTRRVWIAVHDEDEDVTSLCGDLWRLLDLKIEQDLCSLLLVDVEHHEPVIQEATSRSIASAATKHPQIATILVQHLIELFRAKLERPPVQMDALGRVLVEQPPDEYQSRIGVAMVLKKLAPIIEETCVPDLFQFFVPQALGDTNEEVRHKILDAAICCVDHHGQDCSDPLFDILDDFLKNAPNQAKYDIIRQSVVILLGTLARHLAPGDPKVKPIVVKLVETLSTPSQAVQEAVANCLPALTVSIKEDAAVLVKKLLYILLDSDSFGERKGAAYGLAGMVKGLGIISFKQLDIIKTLVEAVQDKKNFKHREGSLLAFEMFCRMLGRLFEPYVKQIIPHLLFCYGDGNQFVRAAANNTAKAIMQNLSSHGVRLVLPSLLEAIHTDDSWRTKTGSAELLGAMAHCAPKQLSSCLPSIVPKLCQVLTDSHAKVQGAGRQALSQIASVIRNPEVQAISSSLHSALCDPTRCNEPCLEKLLNTKFIHKIDAPSLALILPVITRAFDSRATSSRKMAAQIIGNMYSLTEQKDLEPYLNSIIPGLKNTLLDPVPEVRGHAAKALGSMVKGSNEKNFEDLFSWLMETLTSEQSSVDRSGAAQGLSETLAALGPAKLKPLMGNVIETAQSENIAPHVRDGYIMLFIYLPSTFGDDFVPYIGDVIMPILKALADENEFLRSTALRAGQRIINTFAETAIAVLLPELEAGIYDDNWRIRLSSVQLLGDLLFHLSGVSGKMSASGGEDENFGTTEGFKAIARTLGYERRNVVLSGLYICRADNASRVRQTAVHVWKIIVPNTPRLLREILPTLLEALITNLGSRYADKRTVAAKTLGDVVRKLGERTLPDLIPILERNLDAEEASQRQGVCIGLSEIINACSKDAISVFTDNLVPGVRRALCDPLESVRTAAACTFENLHNTIGVQALDGVLPQLLKELVAREGEEQEYVVDGLKQIIAVKGKYVLPHIVPKLLEDPVDTQILALLSSVAGDALTRHLPSILKALQSSLARALGDSKEFDRVLDDATLVVLSVDNDHGYRIIMDDLVTSVKSGDSSLRYGAIVLLQAIIERGQVDNSDYYSIFIHEFIRLLADDDEKTQRASWQALSSVTKKMDTGDMQPYISSIRHAFRTVKQEAIVVETGVVPGFCLPKLGLTPLLPILREGILNGSADIKEQGAKCLCDGINLLTPFALKHSVVTITGPLIRVLGDRFGSNVRVAVLDTLALLLEKVGMYLKPFLPQLQTTFCKALLDTGRIVRIHAGLALKHLCNVHLRLDPLITDLHNSIKSNEDAGFRETYLQALRNCILSGGKKLGPKVKTELIPTLSFYLKHDDDAVSNTAAGCLGSLICWMDENQISQVFQQEIKENTSDSWSARQGRSALIAVAMKESYTQLYNNDQYRNKILSLISSFVALDRVQMVNNGIHGAAYTLLNNLIKEESEVSSQAVQALCKGLEHASNDVKNETCRSMVWVNHHLIKSAPSTDKEVVTDGEDRMHVPISVSKSFVPLLIPIARERNVTLRASAESALISLFQLRLDNSLLEDFVKTYPGRDAHNLQEAFQQRLKRLSGATEIYEEIDDTIIA